MFVCKTCIRRFKGFDLIKEMLFLGIGTSCSCGVCHRVSVCAELKKPVTT